jgi:5'-3' exoribonuclease 1
MGIKHFFRWFKNSFSENIQKMRKGDTFADEEIEIEVDNFFIDMNGLFHGSAQRAYEYGAHAPLPRLLGKRRQNRRGGLQRQLKCFKDVCDTVEMLVKIVNPRKRVILCVDGPAPLSKQNQQRQRRFRSAMERDEKTQSFDSNCITPGTKWMDFLSKYIDWWIRKKMSEDSAWRNLEVVFSNEKSPGEGEHKIINYIRLHGNPEESFCIHGADADLLMLSLGTHFPHFYILRDDMYNEGEYFAIDIGGVRQELGDILVWEGEAYTAKTAVNDFILMCFMVGNDFLPHIPAIEIIQGGIDTMIDVYKQVCEAYGHLTEYRRNEVRFVKKPMEIFLGTLSQYEKGILQEKMGKKANFFPDPLLEQNTSRDSKGELDVDIKQYRKDYYAACLPDIKRKEQLCHEYLEGMQWVLSYYTRGVPNWKWRYPYHYAPFAYTLAKYTKTFRFPVYGDTKPTLPFIQLLSVLPPKSQGLIPHPLGSLLTDEKSPLKDYCPDDFDIDLSGKRQAWEGTVILPMIDYSLVESNYFRLLKQIDSRDIKRNVLGRSYVYRHDTGYSFLFKSFYGDFTCKVRSRVIQI